jgi:hypothetical protein
MQNSELTNFRLPLHSFIYFWTTHSLDVQQHCLCALCNFAGVKECAAIMVSQGAVAAIIKMCDAMKNEELNRQCAESLSNLAGVSATHEYIVGDGGVSALVDLASHGLIDEDEEETKDSSGRRLSIQNVDDDDLDVEGKGSFGGDVELTPMITFYMRVPPRKGRKSDPLGGVDHIEAVLDHESTKRMESHINRVATTRSAPPAPEQPVLFIDGVTSKDQNSSDGSPGGAGGVNGAQGGDRKDSGATRKTDGNDDDEDEDDIGLGASQVLELVEKHVGKYDQLALTETHLTIIDKMRHEERISQSITIRHFDAENVKRHKIDHHNEVQEGGKKTASGLDVPRTEGPGSTTSVESADGNSTSGTSTQMHVRSRTGKYIHDNRGSASRQLDFEGREGEEGGVALYGSRPATTESTVNMNALAAMEAERTGLRSRGVFPVQLPKGAGGKLGLTKIPVGESMSLFQDTNSFLGHLDDVLGPLQQQRKSRRPRKEIKGQWPFDKE